jgi:hypothetical protein
MWLAKLLPCLIWTCPILSLMTALMSWENSGVSGSLFTDQTLNELSNIVLADNRSALTLVCGEPRGDYIIYAHYPK